MTPLLAISSGAGREPAELAAWVARLGGAGVNLVQIREKALSDRRLLYVLAACRSANRSATGLLVNGRADVAVAADLDGVHLPSRGVPIDLARRLLGAGRMVGVSTHRVDEVAAARQAGADYVTFGPVYPTPGKERYGPPLGLAALRRAASLGIPVYALGGVTIDRLPEIAAAGAAGAAGIRMFSSDADLGALAARVRRCFNP